MKNLNRIREYVIVNPRFLKHGGTNFGGGEQGTGQTQTLYIFG